MVHSKRKEMVCTFTFVLMVAFPMCEQGQVILLGLDSNFTESNILGLLLNYTHI